MSGAGTVVRVLVGSLLVCGALGAGWTPVSGQTTEELQTDHLQATPDSGQAQTADRKTARSDGEIDPRLLNRSGSVPVLARLSAVSVPDDADRDETVGRLKRQSGRSQTALRSFARSHDGIRVVNRFWLVNRVLLRIDLARTNLSRVAAVDGVERLGYVPKENATESRDSQTTRNATAEATPGRDGARPTQNGSEADQRSRQVAWQIAATNATGVWDRYDTRGDGVRVAVLDRGINTRHPTLELYTEDPDDRQYPGGWAEFDNAGNRLDGSRPHIARAHGQSTSGLVAADNASGYAHMGVAPDVELLHGAINGNREAALVGAIQWAIEADADVVSISQGYPITQRRNDPLVRAVRRAQRLGIVVVGSAGNNGPGERSVTNPGAIYETIAVGATDREGRVTSFSSSGTYEKFEGPIARDQRQTVTYPPTWPLEYGKPDVVAPGRGAVVPAGTDGTRRFNGTSASTPLVAGTVALMESASDESVHPGILKTALRCSASPPANADEVDASRYGAGSVDAFAATKRVVDGQGIEGTIVDRNGESIPRAHVTVSDCASFASRSGTYGLSTAAGRQTLRVTAPGYESRTVTVDVPEGEYVTRAITLERGPLVQSWNDTYPRDFRPRDGEESQTGTVRAEVTGLEALRIDAGENNTIPLRRIDPRVVVYREPDAVASAVRFGEWVQFEEPETNYVVLSLELDGERKGVLDLDVTLRGSDSETVRDVSAQFSAPPTPTATPSSSPKPSPTAAQTPTPTAAPTPDPTASPVPTETSTAKETETPTRVRAVTATETPREARTVTATETPTETRTETTEPTGRVSAPEPDDDAPSSDSPSQPAPRTDVTSRTSTLQPTTTAEQAVETTRAISTGTDPARRATANSPTVTATEPEPVTSAPSGQRSPARTNERDEPVATTKRSTALSNAAWNSPTPWPLPAASLAAIALFGAGYLTLRAR